MARGHRSGASKGDVRQLPGVFIIDAAGRIRFSHFAQDPSAHPSPRILLEAVQGMAA